MSLHMSFSPLFPLIDHSYILSFQFSSWYPAFSDLTIKSKVIRPLSQSFRDYLDSDGIFVPEGSEDVFVPIIIASRQLCDVLPSGPFKASYPMTTKNW